MVERGIYSKEEIIRTYTKIEKQTNDLKFETFFFYVHYLNIAEDKMERE